MAGDESSSPAKCSHNHEVVLESTMIIVTAVAVGMILTVRNGISVWERILRSGWLTLGAAGLCGLIFGFVRWKWFEGSGWRRLLWLFNSGLAFVLGFELMSLAEVSDPWVGALTVVIQVGITGLFGIVLSQIFHP